MACGEMVAVMEPQEIDDEEHEQVLVRQPVRPEIMEVIV